MEQGEIILYQPDEAVKLEVRLEDETVWLTQAQLVELFQSSKANISEHIKNIYEQGELEENSTVRDFRTVRQEGKRQVVRNISYYNLDAIISIGFRVNSKRGILFRQWKLQQGIKGLFAERLFHKSPVIRAGANCIRTFKED